MSIELKKGAILVSVNQIVVEGAVLFRNILLARLLGPEQMGMAIMLAITLRFLEMISYLAADRLLVQARDGNTSRFQSNAHGLEVIRGFLSGITLCALAYPAAIIFGYPDIAWAFSVLGLSPMLRGFIHLDYRRFQRILRFDLTLKVESLASICGLLAVWPAWILIGDYSVLVWISLIQAIAQVGFSHAYARRPYCLRFQRQYLFRMLKFGWPMLVNSLLMFGVFQGDRLIVAVSVTADQLSRFALALQLGLLPTLILARGSLSLLLPILSRQQDHKIIFQKLYQRSLLFLSLTAMVFAIGYLFFGNLVIALFFGANFVVDPAVLAWLGCALAIRIVRVGPSTAALALGDSKTLLFANMWRLGGLVIAAYAGLSGMGLSFISMAAAIGETLALIAGIFLLYRHTICIYPSPYYFSLHLWLASSE
jgi:O-antigen/teichoic acid export membrane protein